LIEAALQATGLRSRVFAFVSCKEVPHTKPNPAVS
jgi:beta-phosphoglucomutase-like phosphatase (HAD superfamily)